MAYLTGVTCYWGRRGSGKTTLAKKIVMQHRPPQVLMIDPLAGEGLAPAQIVDAINAGQPGMVCNAQDKASQLGALYTAYLLSTPARPIYVVCDEAPAYLDSFTPGLRKIMFQGRHAGFGMSIIGQRPAAVDANIRSQAEATYWLGLSDHVDLATAAQSIGTEKARTLSGFAPGQFLRWPE